MSKRKPKKPPRPKLRRWFPKRGPSWLTLEPARLAMLGAVFSSTCTLLIYLVRQLIGEQVGVQDIAIGVSLVFLVSYAGIGFFVWYVLHVVESDSSARNANGKRHETAPEVEPPAAKEHPQL